MPSMYGKEFDDAIQLVVEKINRGGYDHMLADVQEMYPSYMPGSGPIRKAINERQERIDWKITWRLKVRDHKFTF